MIEELCVTRSPWEPRSRGCVGERLLPIWGRWGRATGPLNKPLPAQDSRALGGAAQRAQGCRPQGERPAPPATTAQAQECWQWGPLGPISPASSHGRVPVLLPEPQRISVIILGKPLCISGWQLSSSAGPASPALGCIPPGVGPWTCLRAPLLLPS